ncbi:coniferyl aldehyde dehydrogenase [Vibrio bivalvicida]|uniref:Aldehyde dehydrogenase n=1 Tax=Vibrio bivalvicida TaxID=1276888 RepID=A0ABV4MI58_9VIBR
MNQLEIITEMKTQHQNMINEFKKSPNTEIAARIDKLNALRNALKEHRSAICQAASDDYGKRSIRDTLMADILPCIQNIDYTIENLQAWSAPSVREPGALLAGSEVEVIYQPKGVIGIVTPWNFPVMLSVGPLISAIAAGNRAMIKMSEFTPATNNAVRAMLAGVFPEDEVSVIEGEVEVSSAFSSLPFAHILFTGSTAVGRIVMQSAAQNLTPVTLELGGKSPVVVADDVSIELAVERTIYGKSLNNGQVCVAPDYVLVPRAKVDQFVAEYKKQYQQLFKEGVRSESFTSVINERQYSRIKQLLAEEIDKGTRVVACHEESEQEDARMMVTHLVVEPELEAAIMQEEIFGPLLPVIAYDQIDEALDIINSKPKPLALYLMTFDPALENRVKTTIQSGGMCVNDCVFHLAADDAPFGGVGDSGMGSYHGKEGFITFSHGKTVLKTGLEHRMKYLFSDEDNPFKDAVMAAFN